MSITAWLLFISLIISDVGAYIYMTLQLKKIERFESDLYKDAYEKGYQDRDSEIVKCNDCRYREEDHRCRLIGLLTRDYDFCSYAEKGL